MVILSREQLTQKILVQKLRLNLRWADVAGMLRKSKEWTTAACLGQMQMTKIQAETIRDLFLLNDEECAWLQIAPHKSTSGIPSDPLLYRFYEVGHSSYCVSYIWKKKKTKQKKNDGRMTIYSSGWYLLSARQKPIHPALIWLICVWCIEHFEYHL